jgi:hypothetical protein
MYRNAFLKQRGLIESEQDMASLHTAPLPNPATRAFGLFECGRIQGGQVRELNDFSLLVI